MANNLTVSITQLSQDIAKNTSVIRVTVTANFQYYASCTYGTTAYVTIDGVNTSFGAPAYNVGNGGSVHIGTFDRVITHNADGTRSVGASASWTPPYVYPGGLTFSGSASTNLTTIPRASSFSISGNTLGSAVSVSISRASTAFTHTVRYQFGSLISEYTGKTTSCSFTPPLTDASQIPNTTSGVGSITVYTYSGSTLIGSKSSSITLNLPSTVIPTFDTFSITRVNGSVPIGWTDYVEGISKATLTISEEKGIYGSTISSFSITGGGYSGGKSLTTGTLASGNITFTGTITDSRGRSASKTQTITVYANTPPSLTIKVARCDSTGKEVNDGTYVKVSPVYSCASVNGKNKITSKVFSIVGTSYSNTSCESGASVTLGSGAILISKSYEISGEVKDALGQSSGVIKVSLSSSSVPINLHEKGIALGGYYDASVGGSLQVKEKTGKMTSCPFPVGFIISNSLGSFNPNTEYPNTTWTRYAQGRFLAGINESDSDFGSSGKVGGHKLLQSHTHTATTSIINGGSHTHNLSMYGTDHEAPNYQLTTNGNGFAGRVMVNAGWNTGYIQNSLDHSHSASTSIANTGGGNGQNLPPYISVYMWVRTA